MSNKTDGVPKEPKAEPDIAAISRLMDDELTAGEKRQQGGMSAVAATMSKIAKDFHGHKGAVRTVRTLEKKDDEELVDFMRTFVPLALARGLFSSHPDLMDMVEGNNAPAERRHVAPDATPESDDVSEAAGGEGGDGDDDGEDGDDGEAAPPPPGNALQAAQQHLQRGTRPTREELTSNAEKAEQAAKNAKIDAREKAAASPKKKAGKPTLGIVPGGLH